MVIIALVSFFIDLNFSVKYKVAGKLCGFACCLSGQALECSLAKPQADQKPVGGTSSHKSGLLPTYPPHVGYGLVGGPYGALGAGFGAAGFAQVRYICLSLRVLTAPFLFLFYI